MELEELSAGVWLADPKSGKGFKTGRSRVKVVKRTRDKSVLEITIREGRPLQASLLQAPKLISRNQIHPLVFQRGGLRIVTSARTSHGCRRRNEIASWWWR